MGENLMAPKFTQTAKSVTVLPCNCRCFLYPGCIAETGLFRNHIPFILEAGKRLAQVVRDPSLSRSGVYWSWNGTTSSFKNQLSKEVSDAEKAQLWEVSKKLAGMAMLWLVSPSKSYI
ncbi:hypothetical protein FXO37_02310 [Capsicum annuum]|nr:hypothetical protein FXO37_02310 [Capsicum annuum]